MGNIKATSSTFHPQQCHICGTEYELRAFSRKHRLTKVMREQHICFDCAFWLERLQDPDGIIINGKHYTLTPIEVTFTARKKNPVTCVLRHDGRVVAAEEFYCSGTIPDRFSSFRDNAKFISIATFRKIDNNPFKCKLKGCWDRYNCVRYDLEAEKDGPWNLIPKSHKTGEEYCESFINKNNL